MDGEQTKICPTCAENVKAAAILCPYCRSILRRSSLQIAVPTWVTWLCGALFFGGCLIFFYRVVRPCEDFTKHRDQVVVSASAMQFSYGDRGRYVTTLGTVRNESDWAWKDIQLEVRYFDREGKLIDVGVQSISDVIVQPHCESGFRVRTLADQPNSVYASHKVFVRSAKDERYWP
jgi:hypothetical protein